MDQQIRYQIPAPFIAFKKVSAVVESCLHNNDSSWGTAVFSSQNVATLVNAAMPTGGTSHGERRRVVPEVCSDLEPN